MDVISKKRDINQHKKNKENNNLFWGYYYINYY